jgi:hypothetical protein
MQSEHNIKTVPEEMISKKIKAQQAINIIKQEKLKTFDDFEFIKNQYLQSFLSTN